MSEKASSNPNLLLVDDDKSLLRLLTIRLEGEGYDVTAVEDGQSALRKLQNDSFDVVLSDLRMPGLDGLSLFEEIMGIRKDIPVILMTAHGTIADAVAATQRGVFGFLPKPVDHDELRTLLQKALSQSQAAQPGDWAKDIITRSPEMLNVLDQAFRIAKREVSVLISGASGTGKELLARAIHQESSRHEAPFVPVNCASIPADLMESEFFGHVKGAFTGANEARKGLFHSAQGGSLFLDEIGEMPINLQAKLLRALQEKTVRPVGGEREEPVDVRIIAATHRHLEKEIEQENFRSDLFYRLETFSLRIPPLRERGTDIEHLVFALIDKHAEAQGKQIEQIEPEALNSLLNYTYPGNVRELENAVMRAVTLSEAGVLQHQDLPERLREQSSQQKSSADSTPTLSGEVLPGTQIPAPAPARWPSLEEVEKRYIRKVLEATGGNKRRTAEVLGIARRTLYRRLEDSEE